MINYYLEIYGTETFSRSHMSRKKGEEKIKLPFSSFNKFPMLNLKITYANSAMMYVNEAVDVDSTLPGKDNDVFFTLITADNDDDQSAALLV